MVHVRLLLAFCCVGSADDYSMNFDESLTEDEVEEKSFRMVLPSESHRRKVSVTSEDQSGRQGDGLCPIYAEDHFDFVNRIQFQKTPDFLIQAKFKMVNGTCTQNDLTVLSFLGMTPFGYSTDSRETTLGFKPATSVSNILLAILCLTS